MDHWKMIITIHRIRIAYKSLISAPQPLCCNLWAHWVRVSCTSFCQGRTPFLSPFSTNGHKQKPTIAPLFFYLRSQYTLFAKISLYFPSIHPSYNTVPNYHRRSLSLYRSDQIEQPLPFYGTLFLLTTLTRKRTILVLLYHTRMNFFSSLFLCLRRTPTTTEFQQMVVFQQTDFNDSNGVGTSTSCPCLNYHNFFHLHLLPFHFRRLRRQQHLIVTD